jgi:cell division protein FtsI/penicillin-binding protein 2
VLALAAVAFVAGAIFGARGGGSPAQSLAAGFVRDWTRGDYAAMYADLDGASRRRISPSEFAGELRGDLRTATAVSMAVAGSARTEAGGRVAVPVRVRTRLFGRLALPYVLEVDEPGGEGARISWSRSLTFPGLLPGETLSRRTTLPQRASLLARDGSVLAEGPPGPAEAGSGEAVRTSPLGGAASAILGTVGPMPAARRQGLEAEGVPPNGLVGLSGLELALDDRLRGTPGGELLAGSRVLAAAIPRAAAALRTSVSPALQNVAVEALGGQFGGIVALQPSTGQILAVAGIGLNGLQPPGSTFKMVTVTGVLSANLANPNTVFQYATSATLDGVKLNNANGEECGGSLELAFAVSCNSVFSPLGAKLGSARLVATAESYGFNHETGIAGAPESTLPAASEIQGELDTGSTAIGQGQVLATPLQMATVASTIADGGRRPRLSFLASAGPSYLARASSAAVAHTIRRLMEAVVREGTGTAAAIPGVVVAGKTGTAELKSAAELKASCPASGAAPEAEPGHSSTEPSKEGCAGESEASNTDAWFAAFAPAVHPRIAVCVLLVKDGAGGTTAAPVARQVLEAGLRAGI